MSDISIRGLTRSFGATPVLQGVDLDIASGEFAVLLGPSGCGKSTLLRLVAGLDRPDAGAIAIAGRDVLGLEPKDRGCAMVFQNYALYPHMTVAENIGYPASHLGSCLISGISGFYALREAAPLGFAAAPDNVIQAVLRASVRPKSGGGMEMADICEVAGLGAFEGRFRDGSPGYYLTEARVSDDAKGVGPLMMCRAVFLKGSADNAVGLSADKGGNTRSDGTRLGNVGSAGSPYRA